MTLVIATATGDTPDELYERARLAAKAGADWIEIRLDTPSGLPWDLRAFFAVDRPCLATVRHADDGGRSQADDKTRNDILRRALKSGARGIDVELWNEERGALVAEARAVGARVVMSLHVTDGTPAEETLLASLREMRDAGADWCKIATRVEGAADAATLVRAAQLAQRECIPYALMALNDPFLRLLAPALGMSLAYGSIPGQPAATSGQVAVPVLQASHAGLAPPRLPTGATRAVFLLGHPVAHSRSPAMQTAAFTAAGIDGAYLALDVSPSALAATLAGLKVTNAFGCNLTIPHKESALPLMDELDASATRAGSVNTAVFRDGRAIGHNTDGAGALDALRESGVRVQGARALVLGAGGTARAVAHSLHESGADVTIANRTQARADALGFPTIPWDRVRDVMRNVDLLVNGTSIGLLDDALPAPVAGMLPGSAVLDCVYRAGGTALIRETRAHALLAVPGEAMLLHQGARAFLLWTAKPAPVAAMRAALGRSS